MTKTLFSRDLADKTEELCRVLRRKTLPVDIGLFTVLSIKDLRWINDQLNIETSRFTEYWCHVIAHFNSYVIKRKEIRKWQSAQRLIAAADLPPKAIGKMGLLFIFFRLEEIDNAEIVPDRVARKQRSNQQVARLKKQAATLVPNIDALEQSIASFLSEVLVFYQEPIAEELIASLLDKIKPLQHSNCERVSVIKELAKAVHELDDNAERNLLTAIDECFYPKPTSRVFEYSAKEKDALLTMESVLQANDFSANKAAKHIGGIWTELGPIREPWNYSDRSQALRRLLKRWRGKRS